MNLTRQDIWIIRTALLREANADVPPLAAAEPEVRARAMAILKDMEQELLVESSSRRFEIRPTDPPPPEIMAAALRGEVSHG